LWKAAEGGVMKLLTSGLTDIGSFMNKSTRRDGVELIAKYFNQKQTKRGTYFLKFFACELLNFANVVGQIFFTDMFLGYQFQEFGRDVLSQIEEPINVRDDPLNRVFPKVAKCTFQKFGPYLFPQVLRLRASQLCQRGRTDLLHRHVPWIPVPAVWQGRVVAD